MTTPTTLVDCSNIPDSGQPAAVAPLRDGSAALPWPVPEGLTTCPDGGVTSAKGFAAAGVHAGFRADPQRLDFAVVVADEPCACAATFTTNAFCAAPVTVSREHLDGVAHGCARAVIINSGNANAATGQRGLRVARDSARMAGEALGCPAEEVMVASTGVIGTHLPLEPFTCGLQAAAKLLSVEGGADAARAIMTTDTHPKHLAVSFAGDDLGYPGCTFTVGGMAKGSGMIMPNMATMIAVLTTDAPVSDALLHEALSDAVRDSFNKVTVDSDTSTNDSCYLLASGAAAPASQPFQRESAALARFRTALRFVCQSLARQMAADGEGATRLVTVRVDGARDEADADRAARSVANSPLFKTAVFGHDANWGRIAAALGKSGAAFRQEDVDIDIMGMPVCRKGLTVSFDEDEALRRFEAPEVAIDVNLGTGNAGTTIWTCDFSHEYVTINGDYRS